LVIYLNWKTDKVTEGEGLGLHVLKQHKPWFDEECLGFLGQRKQAKMQWIHDPSQSNVDGRRLWFLKTQNQSSLFDERQSLSGLRVICAITRDCGKPTRQLRGLILNCRNQLRKVEVPNIRGCHCSHWAPDDGRENARNLLSCK
jgi:hypothetical protein